MDENLSIFKKGLLLVGIPLLTQFLFLGMLVKIRGDQAEAQRWAIHSKDVMARAEGAFRLVIEANGDLRAFAVSGDPKFDEVYRHDRQRVTPALAGLRHLISDNSSQQEKLDAVRGKAEEVLAWLDEVRLLIGDGKGAEALRHINALEGKRHIDDMRAALDRFLTREHELDVERQDTLQRTAHEQNWALVVGGVLALAGAGVLLLVFSRSADW